MAGGSERQQGCHERGGWRHFLPLAHGLPSFTSAALQPVCLSCTSARMLAGSVQRCNARSSHLRCVSEVTGVSVMRGVHVARRPRLWGALCRGAAAPPEALCGGSEFATGPLG